MTTPSSDLAPPGWITPLTQSPLVTLSLSEAQDCHVILIPTTQPLNSVSLAKVSCVEPGGVTAEVGEMSRNCDGAASQQGDQKDTGPQFTQYRGIFSILQRHLIKSFLKEVYQFCPWVFKIQFSLPEDMNRYV